MTCIVAVAEKGIVYMGADSVGADVSSYFTLKRKDTKVFCRGPFIFGFTTSFRMGQLLQYALDIPRLPDGNNFHKWLCTEFIDACRKCLEKGGWKTKRDENEKGGNFLVGIHGKIYEVQDDFQVAIPACNFAAIGCGQPYALGSLFSTEGQEPKKRIRKALAVAEEFSGYVRGPFVIMKSKS